MNPFEDAYTRKCQELRQVEILIDELKNSLDMEREKAKKVAFQLEELQKTLHMSRTSTCIIDNRPIITFVTTMRRGGEMYSVATMVDELLVHCARDPQNILGHELNSHLCQIQAEYFTPHR